MNKTITIPVEDLDFKALRKNLKNLRKLQTDAQSPNAECTEAEILALISAQDVIKYLQRAAIPVVGARQVLGKKAVEPTPEPLFRPSPLANVSTELRRYLLDNLQNSGRTVRNLERALHDFNRTALIDLNRILSEGAYNANIDVVGRELEQLIERHGKSTSIDWLFEA